MFFVNIYKRKDSTKLGVLRKLPREGVKLIFVAERITQDHRNSELLARFSAIFKCGKVYRQSPKTNVMDFMVTGIGDIIKFVIPFFLSHPLVRRGCKEKRFHTGFC